SGRSYQPNHQQTTPTANINNTTGTNKMSEELLLDAVVKDFPRFSGNKSENVDDWLRSLTVKFIALDIDNDAKRRWAPQFPTSEALKWYLTQHTSLKTWDEFQQAVRTNYPPTPEHTRASTFQQLLTRKQTMEEKFIHYYTDMKNLFYKYDRTIGLEITTPQKLLELIQRYEEDQQLIDSRTFPLATSDTLPLSSQSSTRPFASASQSSASSYRPRQYSTQNYSLPYYSSYPSTSQPYPSSTRNRSNNLVKKLNFDFILGANWFIQTGPRIEYDRHQVSIHSYHGRSVIPFDKNINHLALDVKLLNTITLPPREASVVQAKTDISSADAVYFDPDSDYLTCKLIQIAPAMLKVQMILHKKPNGGIRFLVDYRKLNSVTRKDSFPQPTTEELITQIGGSKYFTKLDLKFGYFQIPIHEQDKEKTAFITRDGLWEFNALPQGVMNGPPTFQRVMHNLIGNGRWNYVVVYLDDILIFSKDFNEHKQHVNEILSILNKANFQVNPDKCTIAVQEIEYLSHVINKDQIKPSPEKIRAITELAPLTTLSPANEFIGKLNSYRKFIPHFAEIAAPIHKVTNKTKKTKHEFYWHNEQQEAFDEFKHILTTTPLFLQYPDTTAPFILSTDASVIGISGILRQNTKSGTRICYYKSRTLTDTEKRYDPIEREALAIYWSVKELRQYLGDSFFSIETDSAPLINFHKKQIANKRVMHWLFKLQDILHQITEVKHLNRDKNTGPYYLSKHPLSHRSTSLMAPDDEDDGWPPGTDTWDITPTRSPSFFEQLNAVITRHQAKRQTAHTPSSVSTQDPTLSTPLFDLSLDRVYQAQLNDPDIQEKVELLRKHPSQLSLEIKNGILCKLLPRGKIKRALPYIPKALIKDILFTHHDHPLAGHFGVDRTWNNIKNKYYWPNM
ncbi:unnamed protein product, partial [Didymodactylos carnosus]